MLKRKIKNREKTIGMHINLNDIAVARIAGLSGYDFIWIDLEHSYLSLENLMGHILAIKATGTSVIVRVPVNDLTYTKKVIEMGVDGIIFPMIKSAEQANELIAATLYPPYGTRGFGPMNAVGFGFEDVNEYISKTCDNLCRFIQIEHIDAVNCLEEIISNQYIDGYIFGANDLSGSINELGKVFEEKTTALIEKSIDILKQNNKYIGISTGDTSESTISYWSGMGIDMVSAGADFDFLQQSSLSNRIRLEKLHRFTKNENISELSDSKNFEMIKENILSGKTYLGIELGSTRIKGCLINDAFKPIAVGEYNWENSFENGYWTYSIEDIHKGVTECFSAVSKNVFKQYGVLLTQVGAIGVSGMMHGYLAFDKENKLLVPFRTWRNNTTAKAASELSELFDFNIPQRWSIAHLYQAILNNEAHVSKIAHITTLSGYIHYLLTGKYELGIGEASGMFPVKGNDYDFEMLKKFDTLIRDRGYNWSIYDILPKVKRAGENGAYLTEKGAQFLDVSGRLIAQIPMCPPEGDAGTGMVATSSVLPKSANVSAGTSAFAMIVLEKPLKSRYSHVDIATTPDGEPIAMVHCNNCCSELDSWVNMFGEFAALCGNAVDKSTLYELLYKKAAEGEVDCGGITSYNYISGEQITGIEKGIPMCFRLSDSKMTLANFMKSELYTSLSTLKYGMDRLIEKERIRLDIINAHGGLFKVKDVAQQMLSDALNMPVSVMANAGEGGAWGMALLAAYMINNNEMKLGEWLSEFPFKNADTKIAVPNKDGVAGFNKYMKRYICGLAAERKLREVE